MLMSDKNFTTLSSNSVMVSFFVILQQQWRLSPSLQLAVSMSILWIKPSQLISMFGAQGGSLTLEWSYSNMHYLHSVQLPSCCGLGKQCSSSMAAPSAKKKPPPKLVLLWPVIKTWVWMRACVSPRKIIKLTMGREMQEVYIFICLLLNLTEEKCSRPIKEGFPISGWADLNLLYTCSTVAFLWRMFMCAWSMSRHCMGSDSENSLNRGKKLSAFFNQCQSLEKVNLICLCNLQTSTLTKLYT